MVFGVYIYIYIYIYIKGKINLLIQTINISIDPIYKLLKIIDDKTIFMLIA